MLRSVLRCVRCLAVAVLFAGCRGDPAASPPAPASAPASAPSPDPAGTYMGREIAATMSHLGAEWLVRPERDAEEDTARLHDALDLRPGDVACDFGAGNGYHTLRMAKSVGPEGRVLAIDLQPKMLDLLEGRVREAGVTNVELVEAEAHDPHVPPGTCDVVLVVDVYHELDAPAAVLAHLRRALTPTGRIAIVEFRAEDPDVPIKPLHKMTRAQILKEMEASGLRLVGEVDGLPWQHVLFFAPA